MTIQEQAVVYREAAEALRSWASDPNYSRHKAAYVMAANHLEAHAETLDRLSVSSPQK